MDQNSPATVIALDAALRGKEFRAGDRSAFLQPKGAEALRRLMAAHPRALRAEELVDGNTACAAVSAVSALRRVLGPFGYDVVRAGGSFSFARYDAERPRVGRKPSKHYPEAPSGPLFSAHVYRATPNPTEEERARTVELLRSGAVPLADALDALYPATRRR